MFCRYCGAEIPDGSRFCIRCGAVLTEENGGAMSGAPENESGMDAGRSGGRQEQIPDSRQLSAGAGSGQTDQNQGNQAFGQTSGSDQTAGKPVGGSGGGDQKKTGYTMAVVSLVLGIAGIVLCCIPVLGLIVGIVGLILAIMAKKNKGDASGVRTGGLICSIIATIIGVIYLIYWAAVGVAVVNFGQETLEDTSEETEEAEEAQEEEETAEIEEETEKEVAEPEITFESATVLDNDEISIVITGIEEDDDWGFMLDAEIENKTADRTFTVSMETAYVNGVQYVPLYDDATIDKLSMNIKKNTLYNPYPFDDTTVSPGFSGIEKIDITDDDLEEYGIEDITEIEMVFIVEDDDTYETVYEGTVDVYPYGEENASAYERESQDSDIVVVDNDYAKITVIGYESDNWGLYEVKLYCENKTDQRLSFRSGDGSVNGYITTPYLGIEIDAGKSAFDSISWEETDLEDMGITDTENGIETIEVVLSAYNEELTTDYINKTITLNP